IVSSDFVVAAVSPGRLPSASQDRAPGYVARFVENQLHAPRTVRHFIHFATHPIFPDPDSLMYRVEPGPPSCRRYNPPTLDVTRPSGLPTPVETSGPLSPPRFTFPS